MTTNVQINVNAPGGTVTGSVAITHEALASLDITVASDAANVAQDFTLDVSRCNYIMFLSDVALLIETNSDSAPTDTLVLTANVPYFWAKSLTTPALPIAADGAAFADITKLYLTNQSSPAAAGTLTIRCGYDPNAEVS